MAKDIKGKEYLVTAVISAKELMANFDKAKVNIINLQDATIKITSIKPLKRDMSYILMPNMPPLLKNPPIFQHRTMVEIKNQHPTTVCMFAFFVV